MKHLLRLRKSYNGEAVDPGPLFFLMMPAGEISGVVLSATAIAAWVMICAPGYRNVVAVAVPTYKTAANTDCHKEGAAG